MMHIESALPVIHEVAARQLCIVDLSQGLHSNLLTEQTKAVM